MERLIPVINELQDVFNAIGKPPLDLPHLIAIGSQSSGKSSVLEGLVGRDFLPRGVGLVTRRPIVLHLYHTKTGSEPIDLNQRNASPDYTDNRPYTPYYGDGRVPENNASSGSGSEKHKPAMEWVEFNHNPGVKYFDFKKVQEEIQRETDRLTGKNKGISSEPIVVKIFSPHVLNLTLVDLPGITKVPTGDQPQDIEAQLRDLCISFAENPRAIILAVSAANTDITNSDAIQIARLADPDGERTIGVLTKLDLMDAGTDAVDVLKGRAIRLKNGFVGMVNRSQRDIENGKSMDEALAKERIFFDSHPSYRHLSHRMGTHYLSTLLNSVLMSHIREQLPAVKSQVSQHIMNIRRELETLGDPVGNLGSDSQGSTLLYLISKFASSFTASIDGQGQENIRRDQLWGGARIQHIFSNSFQKTVERFNALDGLKMDDVRHAIRNATGPKSALFVPEGSFEALARKQVSLLEEPALQCVEQVFAELLELSRLCAPAALERFGDLKEKVIEVVHNLLRRLVEPTKMMISNIISVEKAYINTSHPDFIGGSEAVNRANELVLKHNASSDMVSTVDDRESFSNRVGDPELQSYIEEWFKTSVARLEAQSAARTQDSRDKNKHGRNKTKNQNNRFTFGENGNDWEEASLNLPPPAGRMDCLGKPVSHRELYEVFTIVTLLNSYFGIVRKSFVDLVPKIAMCYLINQARDNIQSELVRALYTEGNHEYLLRESEDVAQRRRQAEDALKCLNEALRIIDDVREFDHSLSNAASK